MSHTNKTHVMVPADPRPRLVLRHAQVALAILEILLDLVARAGNLRQHLQRRRGVAVADVVLDLGRRLQTPPYQQPDRRASGTMTHRPDPHCGELEAERPFGALTDLQRPPTLGRQ